MKKSFKTWTRIGQERPGNFLKEQHSGRLDGRVIIAPKKEKTLERKLRRYKSASEKMLVKIISVRI